MNCLDTIILTSDMNKSFYGMQIWEHDMNNITDF